jgi:hypothetical protein
MEKYNNNITKDFSSNFGINHIKNGYFPLDVVYGLLSAHCADETGRKAGHSIVKKGNKVKFNISKWV